AEVLQRVEEDRRPAEPNRLIGTEDEVAELLLAGGLVEEAKLVRNHRVDDDPANGGLDPARLTDLAFFGKPHPRRIVLVEDWRVIGELAMGDGHLNLTHATHTTDTALAGFRLGEHLAVVRRLLREPVAAHDDVLRRRGNRPA